VKLKGDYTRIKNKNSRKQLLFFLYVTCFRIVRSITSITLRTYNIEYFWCKSDFPLKIHFKFPDIQRNFIKFFQIFCYNKRTTSMSSWLYRRSDRSKIALFVRADERDVMHLAYIVGVSPTAGETHNLFTTRLHAWSCK